MQPVLTTFRQVPTLAQGLVRDLRVRWALEEIGQPYRTRLIDWEESQSAGYLRQQPFAQVPVLEIDGLTLFESGAIALHLAERHAALMPSDPAGRQRARVWVLAALNSVEPTIQPLGTIDLFHPGAAWAIERRPAVEADLRRRLGRLAAWLGDHPYLEDRFTVGDLMMATVLRMLRHTDLVTGDPVLGPYLARCEARPAFGKALADHMAVYAAAA